MTTRTPKPRQRGLTLVEVVIVVLILGIAAGLAMPLLGHTDATRLAEAAKLIEADLAFAQVASITHGDAPRNVVFDAANRRYEMRAGATLIANPVGGGIYRTTFGTGRAAELAGVQIESATPATTLWFGVYGQLCPPDNPRVNLGQDAVITLRCGGKTLTLTVDDATGEVTISNTT